MWKRILIISYCLQSCFLIYSQDTKFAMTLSPATISMPEWSIAIQPGMQYRLNSRFSVVTEFCVPIVGISRNASVSDQQYFRVKGELKYYLHPAFSSSYISLESSYAFREFTVRNSTYFKEQQYDSVSSYQQASVSSPIWITNLKVGREYNLGTRFKMDLFVGMGFRNINTRYSNLKGVTNDPYMRPYCRIFPSSDPAWWYEGNLYRFNATAGFRAIYQF